MDKKEHKTELKIYTECFFTLTGLKEVIEEECNCNCTLLEVKNIDTINLKK